jgi:hypothetical protein
LESLLTRQPELKAEFEKLQGDARLAQEVVPLLAATESSAGEFPAYARERLQTKVRQTLGTAQAGKSKIHAYWRWALGLASVTAVITMLLFLNQPSAPTIQVAMLDVAGTTRGNDTNELVLLRQKWNDVQSFTKTDELGGWEQIWPAGRGPMFKVIYDRNAGEVRVVGRVKGGTVQKAFPVERDLAAALMQAEPFILEQTGR